jgi:hypothetical protein
VDEELKWENEFEFETVGSRVIFLPSLLRRSSTAGPSTAGSGSNNTFRAKNAIKANTPAIAIKHAIVIPIAVPADILGGMLS